MVIAAVTIIAYTSQPITRFFTLANWASVHLLSLEGCVYKTRVWVIVLCSATHFEERLAFHLYLKENNWEGERLEIISCKDAKQTAAVEDGQEENLRDEREQGC